MHHPILRAAHPCDFAFCERLYFVEMDYVITRLGFDIQQERESLCAAMARD
jgi:hypothetical protein